jgi:glycogen synthase
VLRISASSTVSNGAQAYERANDLITVVSEASLADRTASDGVLPLLSDAQQKAESGTLIGAIFFLLALVPFVYTLVMAWLAPGIVVVVRPQESAPAPTSHATFMSDVVMVASIEHDITYDLAAAKPGRSKVSAGGLGKVAGQLQRIHPTDLISVHPVFKDAKYGFEPEAEDTPAAWEQDPSLSLTVDGHRQTVFVFRHTVSPLPGEETKSPQVTYLMLEHPWFRDRTGIYLDQPGSVATLRFFSLWNQAVGALIAREDPRLFQCPDYHTAMAPWYALRAQGRQKPPPRVAVVLHNAEYQGAISSQQLKNKQRRRLAEILDLPQILVDTHMMAEGGFNMLQAGLKYVTLTQRGFGVCAVSGTYAEESKIKHRVLWPLPEVMGLDNPMLENERPKPGPPLVERKRIAKEALYAHPDFKPGGQGYGHLQPMPGARIFVFLGRWVKQKGMDYIADIAEWMVQTHTNLQLAVIGPPGDSFGTYTMLKLQTLAQNRRYSGRVKVLPLFYNIGQVHPDVKFAFDFCFMPSRDEPFGYVDIEFGWFGSLTLGAVTGGLGKVPGIYFLPSNVNSSIHICHLFKRAVEKAMGLSERALVAIAEEATGYAFPVESWQASLLELYRLACSSGDAAGTDCSFLEAEPGIRELFARLPEPALPRAPRRDLGAHVGVGMLESGPVPFSVDTMDDTCSVGVASASLSFSVEPGGERHQEEMEIREFIRPEVADSSIHDDVERLVRRQSQPRRRVSRLFEQPPSAQDVLAVTQWNAMRKGEYQEDFELDQNRPFCGILWPVTKFLTSWLAGEFLGFKRIDLAICLHYLTAPLLQAWCLQQLGNFSLNRWPLVFGALINPFAVVFWVKLSMWVQPSRIMALAVVLRIPFLFVPAFTMTSSDSLDTVGGRTVLFLLLGFLAGADQIFVFYNFMGAAVGDISKLALRMGACNGILIAISFMGQAAFSVITIDPNHREHAYPISVLGAFLNAFLALLYGCAPAAYREFRFPEWDLWAMWEHRRTLRFLGVGLALGAITDSSVSGAAAVTWRKDLLPFRDQGLFGFWLLPSIIYVLILPMLLATAVLFWSYFLYRIPNNSQMMVKAGAFLLVPPALLRSLLILGVGNDVSQIAAIDCLLLLSFILDMFRSTCVYVAILAVVGSRWRFVSFVTVTLFVQGLLSFLPELTQTAMTGHEDMSSGEYARTFMPVIAILAVLQWGLSFRGFFWYDQESQALFTTAKAQMVKKNNAGLRQYLRSLESPSAGLLAEERC